MSGAEAGGSPPGASGAPACRAGTFTDRSHARPEPVPHGGEAGEVATRGARRTGLARLPTAALSGAHVVLEVRLPDRPGGLGAVASRIGAVGADITDVIVAGRDDGAAIDVFHITLPRSQVDLMALLAQELGEVDGVAIRGWRTAGCCGTGPGPDPDEGHPTAPGTGPDLTRP